MPPKPKYTREEIIDAAYEIVREEGADALVARNVGKKLNTTASPIFTFFSGMDELKAEVVNKARQVCREYLRECVNYVPAFKEFGMRYVAFANNEPNLYRLLFIYGNDLSLDYYSRFEDMMQPVLKSIMEAFHLNEEDSKKLFNQMIIHANGICALSVNNNNEYSYDTVGDLLSETCLGIVMVMQLRNGSFNQETAARMASSKGLVPKKIN